MTGSYNQLTNVGSDVIILKFNNQGQRLWASYYGGSSNDFSNSIKIDNQNNIFIIGTTNSNNFPTQSLAGAYNQFNNAGLSDLYILKFNILGVRLWATYYGGINNESFSSMCIDSQDNIYLTGDANSTRFPAQFLNGAYWQPTNSGTSYNTFILKFNNQGQRLWAT